VKALFGARRRTLDLLRMDLAQALGVSQRRGGRWRGGNHTHLLATQ